MIKIIANLFGVLSTLSFIVSFQIKSNKALFLVQSLADVFYCIQFYLLGATGGLFYKQCQAHQTVGTCLRITCMALL